MQRYSSISKYNLLLFIAVYSRILIGWESTMNFSYVAGGVSTWQIIIVFVMCSRHQRQIRDLFVMCSRHQSYLPLFVMFVWAFTTDFGKGVCSVCSLNCGFASVSAEQIEQILEDKDSENTKKVQNSEACILGIKNIRLTWGLLAVLIFIYMADLPCKMNNKRLIEFGLRRISELFRPRSALSASAFGFGK